MGIMERFLLPKDDHFAEFLLYGMVFSTRFNWYDAGIMIVNLADKQFIEYYGINDNKSGLVATIPWAMTGGY
ncbi:Major facilitator superfamily domain general substrate transporter [Penicillium cf. viridicatum]|uniref:Major facilitator superfamily domain general substrate transporter n=1 Tax=Penicillium cf. viridicatum TaxID=2972119 RepID=A0A9W9IXL5_9EURO|nr:Major facilitator superfamily domain general substrate transporter [Penicillium cf. viridicatum]